MAIAGALVLFAIAAGTIGLILTPPYWVIPVPVAVLVVVGAVWLGVWTLRRRGVAEAARAWTSTIAASIWIAVLAWCILFFPVVPLIFGSVLIGAVALMLSAAFVLLAVGGLVLSDRRIDAAAALAVLIGGVLLLVTLALPIIGVGIELRLRFAEGEYRQTIATIESHPNPASFHRTGDLLVEPGPPVRVGFIWWSGVLDNVGGVVYDPIRSPKDERGAVLSSLDPGMTPVCTHLYGAWFYCAFN